MFQFGGSLNNSERNSAMLLNVTAAHTSASLRARCLIVLCHKSFRALAQNTISAGFLLAVCRDCNVLILALEMITQYFADQTLVAEHSQKLPSLCREQCLN